MDSQLCLTTKTNIPTGPVNIQSDIGTYLARCNDCGDAAYPDSVAVGEANPANPWAIWNL